ncbi:MAG: hypothetical protein ACP5D2_00655 [Candidatus Nanoarchaeia archaeon]
MKPFTYYKDGKKIKICVKLCQSAICKFLGLMFKSNSKPLLFIFNKEKKITIHSLFCKPFKAIWLDDRKRVVKEEVIDKWRLYIGGRGKYLLEIPLS